MERYEEEDDEQWDDDFVFEDKTSKNTKTISKGSQNTSIPAKQKDEDEWDDDFLFDDNGPPLKPTLNSSQKLALPSLDRVRQQSTSSNRGSPNLHLEQHLKSEEKIKERESRESKEKIVYQPQLASSLDYDNIPNIGLDGLELEGDLNYNNDEDFHVPSNDSSLSEFDRPPNSRANSTSNFKTPTFRTPEDHLSSEDRHSSFDNESHRYFPSEDDEDEDEDDWDAEMILDQPYEAPSKSQKHLPLASFRNETSTNIEVPSGFSEKESLLEFLETNLNDKFATPSSSSASNNQYTMDDKYFGDDEECGHEFANHHLNGLTDWMRSTSKMLYDNINDSSIKEGVNARTMMETEVRLINSDVLFVEQILERCEQEPTKETCIYSLEVVVKWIRGICHSFDSETSKSNTEPTMHVSLERLDQLFIRCDYILSEQSKFTVAKIIEYLSILKEELTLISSGTSDFSTYYAGSRANVIGDILHLLCNQISLCRIHIYMLEIKCHITSSENIAIYLESLEVLWEELETFRVWVNTVSLFLIPDSLFDPENNDSNPTNDIHNKYDDALKSSILEHIKIANGNKFMNSLFYHTYKQSYGDIILGLLVELQACCLMDKMFVLSNISPLTTYPRKVKTNDTVDSLNWRNSHNTRTSSESSSYNAIYEISIGVQFVELMMKLESPSIIRSKLAFSACCYLQCLQRDMLPWQSQLYSKIILKKRNVEGYGAFRRGENEVGFGVDGDDIDYYVEDFSVQDLEQSVIQGFSAALGPVDEIRNLRLLLYEASVDLFPNLKKAKEEGYSLKWAYPSEHIFSHISASLDINQAIEEIVQEQTSYTTNKSKGKNTGINLNYLKRVNQKLEERKDNFMDDFIPGRNKSRHVSCLQQFELYCFSFAILSNFITSVIDNLPIVALELSELCALVLYHLNRPEDQLIYMKKAFLLATKHGKSDSAIMTGKYLWDLIVNTRHLPDLEEFIFISKELSKQYCLNAQYELAIKLSGDTIYFLKSVLMKKDGTVNRKILSKHIGISLDYFSLQIAKSYLNSSLPQKAINILTKILNTISDRPDNYQNNLTKITFLCWLVKAFAEMKDFETCHRIILAIKSIRRDKFQPLFDLFNQSEPESNETYRMDQRFTISSPPNHTINHNTNQPTMSFVSQSTDSQSNFRLFSSNSFDSKHNYVLAFEYLLNRSETIDLPKFCITNHNIDLGLMLAKTYLKSEMYISALNSLIPTIIGAELMVGGKSGSRDGMEELAKLYYLRGKIQLDASRYAAASVKYPFEVGSSQLFGAIELISSNILKTPIILKTGSSKKYVSENSIPLYLEFREHYFQKLFPQKDNMTVYTCKKNMIYNSPADLLWDAMKWFRRAWDLFHAAGDEINAAKSANRIAECHLLPTYIPTCFFAIPLEIAMDLAQFNGLDARQTFDQMNERSKKNQSQDLSVELELKQNLPPLFPQASLSTSKKPSGNNNVVLNSPGPSSAVKRLCSLTEVERVSTFALEVLLETSLPLDLMDTYLNLVEMKFLQGDSQGALYFWWEAKELFVHLFVDGTLIPILRRANLGFIDKLLRIFQRIILFLFKCSIGIRKGSLFLFEIYNNFITEHNRVQRIILSGSKHTLQDLNKVLRKIVKMPKQKFEKENKSTFNLQSKVNPQTSAKSFSEKTTSSNQNRKSFFGFGCGGGGGASKTKSPIDVLPLLQRSSGKIIIPPEHRSSSNLLYLDTIENILEDLSKLLINKTSKEFYFNFHKEEIYKDTGCSHVFDKIMDFGWSKFVDYMYLSESLAMDRSTSYDSACSFNEKLNRWDYYKLPSFLKEHVLNLKDVVFQEMIDNETNNNHSNNNCGDFEEDHYFGLQRSASSRSQTLEKQQQRNQNTFIEYNFETPLDPYRDFSWMNETYAMYYTKSFPRDDPVDSSRSPIDFFDPYLDPSDFHHGTNLHDFEIQSEKILILRVWNLILRGKNIANYYSDKQLLSLKTTSFYMRQTLSRISQNMLRLKTFSRQFKPSLLNYNQLLSTIHTNYEFNRELKSVFHSSKPVDSQLNPYLDHRKALQLQHRLPRMTYVLYINKILLVFNPHTGKDSIQLFGEDSCFKYTHRDSNLLASMSIDRDELFIPPILRSSSMEINRVNNNSNNLSAGSNGGGIAVDEEADYIHHILSKEGRLLPHESKLLLEFSAGTDYDRPDKLKIRKDALLSLKYGSLTTTIQSIRDAYEVLEEHENIPLFSHIRLTTSNSNQDILSLENSSCCSAISEQPTVSNHSIPLPHRATPLTLICTQNIQFLPWENLVDVDMVRATCLSSLISQTLQLQRSTFDYVHDSKLFNSSSSHHINRSMSGSYSEYDLPNTSKPTTIKGFLGPGLYQQPCFAVFSWDSTTLTPTLNKDIKVKARQRCVKGMIQSLQSIFHSYDHLMEDSTYQDFLKAINLNSPLAQISLPIKDDKANKLQQEKYSQIVTSIKNSFYPCVSDISTNLINLFQETNDLIVLNADTIDSFSLEKSSKLFFSNSRNDNFARFWIQIENKMLYLNSLKKKIPPSLLLKQTRRSTFSSSSNTGIANQDPLNPSYGNKKNLYLNDDEIVAKLAEINELYYPLIFLTYADLMEMNEALVYLNSYHRQDAVLIFAPSFILEILIKEIKATIDFWCKYDVQSRVVSNLPSTNSNNIPTRTGLNLTKSSKQAFSLQTSSRDSYDSFSAGFSPASINIPVPPPDNDLAPMLQMETLYNDSEITFNSINKPPVMPKSKPSNSSSKASIPLAKSEANNNSTPPSVPSNKNDMLKFNKKIWAYHLLVEVINKVQKQYAVTITIYI